MNILRAAILNGVEELCLIDKPRPVPAAGEVLVRVEYCGICGSDLHAYKSGLFPFGMTIGHEYAGIIEEVGPDVDHLVQGQKVTGTASIACNSCFSCLSGRDNICETMNIVGVTREGAMADYLLAPQESIVVIPESMPIEMGALAEPYSVALHAVKLIKASTDQAAIILGAGAIGLCLLAELKRRGLGKIYVIDLNDERLKTAEEMGATATINPGIESLEKKVNELTSGTGAELVFECVGIPDTIKETVNLARQGGSVVVLGICEIPVDLFFLGLVTREIQIRTSYGSTADEFREALSIIAADPGALEPLVNKVINLEKLVEDGFKPLFDKCCPDIKVLVRIN
ncbi:MAG: alcohol dehydrogenase catalytic domain-containing protein [Bacillota bacterium]|nr:alcohol dehydrogenase catalytic domain-containing protein [Bacillota bacterium]